MPEDMCKISDSPWIRPGPAFLEPFLDHGELWAYGRGSVIYFQGEYSQGVLYLRKGRLKVSLYHEDGREKVLGVHEAPATFGETAAFDGGPYFCSAVALDPCHVYLFRKGVIARLIHSNPEISISLLESVGRKFRALALQVEDLAFLLAPMRIAHLLEKLLIDYGVITTAGERLSIPVTHQELADLAGTSRVTVTSFLNQLEKEGIIQKGRKIIYVHDAGRLHGLQRRAQR